MSTACHIRDYRDTDRNAVLTLARAAWEPVFAGMEASYDPRVWSAFFPQGWRVQHDADVASALDDDATSVFVAEMSGEVAGFSGLREHSGDSMGEIYIIGVAPGHQGHGIGAALTAHALDWMRARGLKVAMVETGSDDGHAPARASYEASGFRRLDVARYFKPIDRGP